MNLNYQVSLLCIINGQAGDKKGGKIINSVVDSIIHRENQFQFSWTGRSSSGSKTKIAFTQYQEIISLILAVCRRADSSYSRKDCEQDLTYKVFKYANTKRLKNTVGTTDMLNNNHPCDIEVQNYKASERQLPVTLLSTTTKSSIQNDHGNILKPEQIQKKTGNSQENLLSAINGNSLLKLLELVNNNSLASFK